MTTVNPVVLLVDNRKRDLDVSALIAHHLRARGVECYLEPLEAFRAVLAAYRPGMIIFNHLFASHLVAWSKRLHDIGVLTAVLTNEGMIRTAGARRFQSGAYHRDGHVDCFLCWNELHRKTLLSEGPQKVEVVGVPRFDFYFEPWSRAVRRPSSEHRVRPKVLICTNVGLARFWELPRWQADRHFAAWANHIPDYGDHWVRIEAHWKARQQFVEYTAALAKTGRYDIVLRPHPSEDVHYYEKWRSELDPAQQALVRIDAETNITSLIMDCDIEIADESCTTAVESWIARKPTIGLVFDRASDLYFGERARCNVPCDELDKLPGLIDQQLAHPEQSGLKELRREYLAKWCATPDGRSCARIADVVASAVLSKDAANWAKLNANDYRRAAKLLALKRLGFAYHFNPFLPIKRMVLGRKYRLKEFAYRKSIKPKDVVDSRRRLESALPGETSIAPTSGKK